MSDLFPGNRLIYHRNAAALIPEISDPDPGMAMPVYAGTDREIVVSQK